MKIRHMLICVLCCGITLSLAETDPLTNKNIPSKSKKEANKGKIRYQGGDGSSIEKAVIILGAKNTMDGITAENDYIRKKLRGYTKTGQALLSQNDRKYDKIVLENSKGDKKEIYFDITDFFGKSDD